MAKRKVGRPSIYTKALGEEICRRIGSGRTTLSVSRDDDMPDRATIYDWRDSGKHPEFSSMYAEARLKLYDHWADEVVEDAHNETRDYHKRKRVKTGSNDKGSYEEVVEEVVSDNTAVQRDRLKVDSKKWLLSRLLPKQYGDKITQEHTGADGEPFKPILNITIKK